MKRVLSAFARNTVFANILLVMIFLAGGLSVKNMIRENFPEFSLDMITITVPYPGADPEEVEEGVSRKIEEALEGTEGIKLITTQSHENVGSALLEVREDYDVTDVLDKVRTRVNAISTFPRDAENPVISELLLKDMVLLLYLSADMSERRIKEWAERFKDEIQQLPHISQVALFGTRDYEIGIEISEQRLRQYGLSLDQVAAAVRRSNLNLGGGTIRTSGEEIRLRTMGRRYTDAELAGIVVLATPEGDLITLDKLATIRDDFTEDPISALINGEPAVMLIVYKTPEEDALTISHTVTRYLQERQHELPQGVSLKVLYDNTQMLRARIDLLVKNGIIGLCIVLLILYIFLDARLSFWAGLGIPISITGAMVILNAMGGTINMISLFGLILVLGIVVDDAIVVGEAIYVHRKNGMPPLRAAVEGVSEVGMPVIAAVLTTIVAFVPLFFVGGIMGKFIAILPVVVIACLAVSLVECLLMLPAHLSHLPDPGRKRLHVNALFRRLDALHRATANGMEWFIGYVYTPFLKKSLYWRYISLCAAISLMLVVGGMVAGGILKFEVFPDIDGFIMTATVEYPAGTPVSVTEQAVQQIDAALLRLEQRTRTVSGAPMTKDRIALIGQTLEDPHVFKSGPHVGSVQAIMIDSEERGIAAKDLMVQWEREIGALPGVKSLTFTGLQAGPPGDPIEVWLQGHEMDGIVAAAETLMAKLRTFDGVYQIRSDFSPGKNEIRFSLKPQAHALGLTVEDLARQVYAGYYGSEALRLQRGRDDVRVKVRYTSDERRNLSDLAQVRIRTPGGHEVPLRAVAEWSFSPGYATITRTNGMRRVSVSAGVDTNRANANEIFAELKATFFPQMMRDHPGIQVDLQGEQKKMRESLDPLKTGFVMALVGILVIIATIFRSYAQPFVILFTVPFGIIGAAFGHLLLGYDLSMMSMFGMVALSGVVVNDAIVMIERVNENLASGMSFFEALLAAGARRFRAVFLTTVSTVGGLAPLILETDLQAKFLIPMALALAAGVSFATLLTLGLVPGLMAILNDLRRLVFRMRHNRWPSREEVEPAATRYGDAVPAMAECLPSMPPGSAGAAEKALRN
ncbi:MAG: efflux RND transporter permease subunit [Desulfobacteraceae bacterium]|nr:MAG: efflux RND transporter permease subunit [Desulfobacteraceae bacterium]